MPGYYHRFQLFNQYKERLSLSDNLIMTQTTKWFVEIRKYFAEIYLKGEGIEIGAQHLPTIANNRTTSIKYVDIYDTEKLSTLTNIPVNNLVKIDYVLSSVCV